MKLNTLDIIRVACIFQAINYNKIIEHLQSIRSGKNFLRSITRVATSLKYKSLTSSSTNYSHIFIHHQPSSARLIPNMNHNFHCLNRTPRNTNNRKLMPRRTFQNSLYTSADTQPTFRTRRRGSRERNRRGTFNAKLLQSVAAVQVIFPADPLAWPRFMKSQSSASRSRSGAAVSKGRRDEHETSTCCEF